jgi:hypothetical protein
MTLQTGRFAGDNVNLGRIDNIGRLSAVHVRATRSVAGLAVTGLRVGVFAEVDAMGRSVKCFTNVLMTIRACLVINLLGASGSRGHRQRASDEDRRTHYPW